MNHKANLIGNLAAFVVTLTLSNSVATAQWIQWPQNEGGNGHWYRLSSPGTWSQAETEAESLGGNLVTIDDMSEQQWLTATFPYPELPPLWIGLYQDVSDSAYSEPAGGWKWISGQPSNFTNWHSVEPNDGVTYGPGYENHAAMHHFSPGLWNDFNCSVPHLAGIIERVCGPDDSPHGNLLIPGPLTSGGTEFDEIHSYNLANNQRTIFQSFSTIPESMTLAPDGFLYIALKNGVEIYKLNRNSGIVVDAVPITTTDPVCLLVKPSGHLLVYEEAVGGVGEIREFDADGLMIGSWASGLSSVRYLSSTPSGTVAFLEGHPNGPNKLVEYDEAGNYLRDIIESASFRMDAFVFTSNGMILASDRESGCVKRFDVATTPATFVSDFVCTSQNLNPFYLAQSPLDGSVFGIMHGTGCILGWNAAGIPLNNGQPLDCYVPPLYVGQVPIIISGDCDSDGSPDDCESDLDTDGIPDDCDNCPQIANPDQADCDSNGVGDACENDCNANGVPDQCDITGIKRVYWTAVDVQNSRIQRTVADGGDTKDVLHPDSADIRGIAIDPAEMKLYWADATNARIQRANIDGSDVEDVVTNLGSQGPTGVALDLTSNPKRVYWSDMTAGKIQRATAASNSDASKEDVLTNIGRPRFIAIDPTSEFVYWADQDENQAGSIWRANLDGTQAAILIPGLLGATGIALDLTSQPEMVYWTESTATTGLVRRAIIDGTMIETLVDLGGGSGLGDIDLDAGTEKIYWSGSPTIRRANLDGTQTEELAMTNLCCASGIALWHDASLDCNANGVPDECEPDCDSDGTLMIATTIRTQISMA